MFLNEDIVAEILKLVRQRDAISLISVNVWVRTTFSARFSIPTLDQMKFVDMFDEGHNIILSGAAGCGKSFCVDFIRKHRQNVMITASTGTAANLIKGRTIDSFMMKMRFRDPRYFKLSPVEVAVRTIVIDEVSMFGHAKLLDLDLLLRKWYEPKKVFGGLQMVLVGDFLQLPPVQDDCFLYSPYLPSFAFRFVYLRQAKRQKSKDFLKMLNEVRLGKVSRHTLDVVEQMTKTEFPEDIVATLLVGTNKEAREYNRRELSELDGDVVTYQSALMISDGFTNELSFRLSTEPIELKVGAHVMLLINLDVSEGLTNGTQGRVVGFSDGFPLVKFNGVEDQVLVRNYVETLKQKVYADHTVPIDTYINKAETLDKLYEFKVETAIHSKIPLTLSWAVTIHKVQGKTIDYGIVDCKRVWVPGHFYVAMSRFIDASRVKVIGFQQKCVQVDRHIVAQLCNLVHGQPQARVTKAKPAYEAHLKIYKGLKHVGLTAVEAKTSFAANNDKIS